MKALVLAVAASLVVAGGVSDAPAAPQFDPQSWVDQRHGWGARGAFVWATEDGGRHWRPILRAGVRRVQRTSVRSGFVVLWHFDMVYVTNDGGRHWYRNDEVAPDGVARGRDFFSTHGGGRRLYRLFPWPPERARCHSYWTGYPLGPAGTPERPRNVCGGTATMTKLRTRVVWALGDQERGLILTAHAIVPGGVLGLVYPDEGPPVGVFVFRNGRGYWSRFPGEAASYVVIVDWPVVVASGKQSTFVSEDGARTWRVVR